MSLSMDYKLQHKFCVSDFFWSAGYTVSKRT